MKRCSKMCSGHLVTLPSKVWLSNHSLCSKGHGTHRLARAPIDTVLDMLISSRSPSQHVSYDLNLLVVITAPCTPRDYLLLGDIFRVEVLLRTSSFVFLRVTDAIVDAWHAVMIITSKPTCTRLHLEQVVGDALSPFLHRPWFVWVHVVTDPVSVHLSIYCIWC